MKNWFQYKNSCETKFCHNDYEKNTIFGNNEKK